MSDIQATALFAKALKKLPRNIQQETDATIKKISEDPYIGEELQGTLKGWRKVRVATDYRLVYAILDTASLRLIFIGHRRNVYEELERYKEFSG